MRKVGLVGDGDRISVGVVEVVGVREDVVIVLIYVDGGELRGSSTNN